MFTKYKSLAIFILGISVFSCHPDKKTEQGPDFDRTALLTHIGNNLIMPSFQDFAAKTADLKAKVTDFNASPDSSGLEAVRIAFKQAFYSWETVTVFDFGPASDLVLTQSVDVFPTDTTQIKSNIAQGGNVNLDLAENVDAKGFPALDYLLYSYGNSTLARFTSDASTRNYLQEITDDIASRANTVSSQWNSYITTFINASGTDVGSSVGIMVNELVNSFEMLKNYKIGIPLGKQTGTPFPNQTEAYYSGISVDLAVCHAQAVLNLYLGQSAPGSNGTGFDDYLTFLNADYQGSSLSDAITSQLTKAVNALKAVPDPLSQAIVNDPSTVNAAYTELQKAVPLLKADMPSAMGVLITFPDNDGD
jgi:predicted lipoprotein